MILLGIDYGSRKVGLAKADTRAGVATPFLVIKNTDANALIQQIISIIERDRVEKIVVGAPLSLSGESGQQAAEVNRFVEKLRESINVEVVTHDERMSTQEAKRYQSSGATTAEDALAAAVILQSYLDKSEYDKHEYRSTKS